MPLLESRLALPGDTHEDDTVPLSLLEQPRRDLVPMVAIHTIPILRWELTTPTDRHSVHENLMGSGESPNVQGDRFGEQIPLVRHEEAVVRLHPSPIGAPGRGRRGGIGRDRPRDRHRLPRIRCVGGRQAPRESHQEQPTDQEQRQHTGHDDETVHRHPPERQRKSAPCAGNGSSNPEYRVQAGGRASRSTAQNL